MPENKDPLQRKIDAAIEAVNVVFSDTSVSRSRTREALTEIRDEVSVIIRMMDEEDGEDD